MRAVQRSLFLRPWLWLLVTAFLLALGSVTLRRDPACREALTPILVLLASAAMYYPQLFLTALDTDVRFSYWAMVSGTLSLYLYLATVVGPAVARRAGRRSQQPSPGRLA
jgi:hypothetical protein